MKSKQRIELLNRLRAARSLILRDAESFAEAVQALENAGQVLKQKMCSGLDQYQAELVDLARAAGESSEAEIRRMFLVIKTARNDAVHEGAWPRHLNTRLAEFILLLEKGLMKELPLASDMMVPNPMTAESWHMVAHVRQQMLLNSFSFLPVLRANAWHLISDYAVARFLAAKQEHKSLTLEQAWASSHPLETEIAALVDPETEARCLCTDCGPKPRLVIKDDRLVGIITAFDLLSVPAPRRHACSS